MLGTLELVTLGCLDTLELVPLGCLGALDGWCCSELNHYGVKLRASVGSLIELWRLRRAICMSFVIAPKGCHSYGFDDRPQGSLSGITASCIVRGREEITVALVASR